MIFAGGGGFFSVDGWRNRGVTGLWLSLSKPGVKGFGIFEVIERI